MIYARAFFDLQLEFAETVSVLLGQPLAETLLDYTNFYIRFALGRGFDPDHPGWQEYVAGLRDVRDRGEWTYRFYLSRSPAKAGPDVTATFGCFAYAPLGSDRVRLHFENNETDGSPLAVERRGERLADLAELFAHLKRTTQQGSARSTGLRSSTSSRASRRLAALSLFEGLPMFSARSRTTLVGARKVRRDPRSSSALRRPTTLGASWHAASASV